LALGRNRPPDRPPRAAGNDADLAVIEFELERCAGADLRRIGDDALGGVADYDIAAGEEALVPLGMGGQPAGEIVERALLINRENDLPPEAFPFQVNPSQPIYGQRLEDVEKVHIEKILAETNWNLSRTARLLDIDRTTLYNKIRRYGLKEPDHKGVPTE
jgi:hypothetical protein